MKRRRTIVFGLAGALLLAAQPVGAQLMPPPVVNPATYESRSGDYVLEVDPSQMHGQGGANYRLTHRGHEVWSGERPFTLLGASVGDGGVVAGYAYNGGLELFAKDDALHLLILDPLGKPRVDDVTTRQMSRVIDGGPEPNVHGLVFDPDNDRVVFRVSNVAEPEVWRPYRLLTGRPDPAFQPLSSMARSELSLSIVDAQPVRGAPLTLVHWWRDDWKNEERGARFTLIDPSGKPVWVLDLPRDYQTPSGDGTAQERLWSIGSKTAILDVSRPAEFEIRVLGTSERVLHRVEGDGKRGWTVRETRRQPYVEPAKATDAIEHVPERQLRYLGAIKLGGRSQAASAVIRGVHHFDLDDQGRFGFARDDGRGDLTLVIGGTGDGSPVETRLGRLGEQQGSWPLVAWAGGKTWLVTAQYAKAEDGKTGWWVDAATSAVRPLKLPAGVSVRALAGRPTGGAALLGGQETPNAFGSEIRTVLLWINAQGQVERGFSEAANNSDSKLLSPDDVAVTTTGEVMVIDVIQHTVVVFDTNGSLQRTIDLEKSWGREPNYPSGIAPDVDGGFIVEDFGAAIPFVRMRADGSVRNALRPRYADGRPTGRLFRVRASPDGAVWGSDGEALLRLGEDGVVEGAVGSEASTDDLGEVAALALGPGDGIYAADRRTGAVHVFGPDGKLQTVCRPDRGDVTEALDSPSLTVAGDGRIYLRPDDGLQDKGGFIEFSSAGQRVAKHSWTDRSRLWNQATGGFWAVNWHDIAVVDEKGHTTRTVARRADRKWLDWVLGAVVGGDGSIAVAAQSNVLSSDSREWAVNLYSREGIPMRTIRQPATASSEHFSYDGRTFIVWQAGEIRVFDLSGRPIGRFKPRPEGKEARDWPLLIAAEGRELWMFDAATKRVHRFEMP